MSYFGEFRDGIGGGSVVLRVGDRGALLDLLIPGFVRGTADRE